MQYKKEYAVLSRLGAPIFVTQLGIIVVSFADTMMLGLYGIDQLAAAAFVNSIFMVPMVMLFGFAGGMTPLVGALFGRADHSGVGRIMRAGITVNSAAAIALMTVMAALYFFLDKMGQPVELIPLIRQYYVIVWFTMLPMAIFNCLQQTCNGVTDTQSPMWIILGANLLNVAGNWLLIFGKLGCPELGLAGAGISTLFARIAAMIAIFVVIFGSKRYARFRSRPKDAPKPIGLKRKIWFTSYPLMIQGGVECFLWSAGAVVCGWFGKVELGAYQVVNTLGQLGFMTYMSFGVATSIRSANYTGRSDIRGVGQVAKAAVHLNLILATLASAAMIIWGRGIIHLFTHDEAVIASALALVPPLVFYQYFDAVQLTYSNALRGTSNVKPLLWISVISYLIVGIPALLILAVACAFENVGVYYSFNVALAVAMALYYIAFRRTLARMSAQ